MARYLGRDDLRPVVVASAAAMRTRHVVDALRADPDSDDTKGFYQWGSMAFYELEESSWPEAASFASTVVELGDWVVDDHEIAARRHNTAYAVEGLVPAYLVAERLGDHARAARFRDAIDTIVDRVTTWQVGGPRANAFIRGHAAEARAAGGVQNGASDPVLRIDVTQHQMHALMLVLDAFDGI